MSESRLVGGADDITFPDDESVGGDATPQDILDAGLAAAAEALASEAGPDGRPSKAARQKARRILQLLRDPEALARELADD